MNLKRHTLQFVLAITLVAMSTMPAFATDLPDPDGKPADMTKKVKVFILMGQSNMLGFGKIGAADKPGSLTHAVKEKGNVATVYSKPLCHGGASNSHYDGNAQTYMDVGLAMGEAMVKLLKDK